MCWCWGEARGGSGAPGPGAPPPPGPGPPPASGGEDGRRPRRPVRPPAGGGVGSRAWRPRAVGAGRVAGCGGGGGWTELVGRWKARGEARVGRVASLVRRPRTPPLTLSHTLTASVASVVDGATLRRGGIVGWGVRLATRPVQSRIIGLKGNTHRRRSLFRLSFVLSPPMPTFRDYSASLAALRLAGDGATASEIRAFLKLVRWRESGDGRGGGQCKLLFILRGQGAVDMASGGRRATHAYSQGEGG